VFSRAFGEEGNGLGGLEWKVWVVVNVDRGGVGESVH